MIKNLIELLDYGFFAEIALAIFATVFVAIVVRTLLAKKELMQQQSNIVFDEPNEN